LEFMHDITSILQLVHDFDQKIWFCFEYCD
jgi:hypothetical protein